MLRLKEAEQHYKKDVSQEPARIKAALIVNMEDIRWYPVITTMLRHHRPKLVCNDETYHTLW